ncbi:ABC transporter substrate-binding protein [Brucella endophytica]|uniref:ABC transporter substrate-binding protein n=1 Tax=Brucella endophytica TaxID=1963359 RepID=A0A916SJ90_9HYPH|nr:ABC transporter substrate-binding protein [Brucella endophytica]GGB02906.1 ABC transporter substrate-binding protein [Brucella endophytica]
MVAAITRRALFGGLALAGLGGGRAIAKTRPPRRVVCLEWTSAEMVTSLGISPIAVGDLKGYRDWVIEPALPDSVLDIGSRSEPNRELLTKLEADLIVGAYGYGLEEKEFVRFAPTFSIPFYDGTASPFAQAVAETRRLGTVLDRERQAEQLIADVENTIARARAKLAPLATRPFCIISIFDDRHVRVYGAGSLFQDVMDKLELTNAWVRPTTSWGFAQIGVEDLVLVGDATVISLDPIPKHVQIRIDNSSLWNNLPCVRNGRVTRIAPVWPFGGLLAAQRFAALLANR